MPFDIPPDELRAHGTQTIDAILRWLERETRDPVLERIDGPALRALLDRDEPPQTGQPFAEILGELERDIARYSRANGHPRYFAYVSGAADPIGILADALTSALNQNVTAWRSAPAAATLERCVLRWLDTLTGFAGGGHGLLTSGGSSANFHAVAMAVARAEREGARREQMTILLSTETHLSLRKAARVLGVPAAHVRALPVDGQRRLTAAAVDQAIAADRAAGLRPVLVCASAGTINTGAIDCIGEIAGVTRAQDLWLHVDGAYGAPAAMTESHAWLAAELARADSLSLDPHKWLYAPLDAGCLLVRDPAQARLLFAEPAPYTAVNMGEKEEPIEAHAFFDHGMDLSRRFRALKLWFCIKYRGVRALAAAIEDNIRTREHLDRRIAGCSELVHLGSGLSASCFRVVRPGLDPDALDALNRRVLDRVLDTGRFLLAPTSIDGAFALRVCILSFRTTHADIDDLVHAVRAAAAGEA
jgi:glutamate/tyrosine decarboxylase-like PLP-dependent enzyme